MHGYNVTFADAVRRTGQMDYDLDFLGPAILFSWPSEGRLDGYFPDEATIEATEHLKRFLDLVLRRTVSQLHCRPESEYRSSGQDAGRIDEDRISLSSIHQI